MSGIVKVIIVIVIGCVAVTGGFDSIANSSASGYEPTSYETTDYCDDDFETSYDDEVSYEEEMPDKVFEPSNMVGKWVDDSDPAEPNIIEIYKNGDEYTYYYYSIVPGDGNGLKLAVETTEWEYCSGSILMNPYRGNFECWNSSNTDTYVRFFYIDEDTIEHADNESYFYRNDYYEYVNPYADSAASTNSEAVETVDDVDEDTIEGCWPPEDCDCGNHDASAGDYTSEEYTAMYSLEALLKLSFFTEGEMMDAMELEYDVEYDGYEFYSVTDANYFDNDGDLEFAFENDGVRFLSWSCEFDDETYYTVEDSLDIYDTIITMLEDVFMVTDGEEDHPYDNLTEYVGTYEGKTIIVERVDDSDTAMIYVTVCE